MEYHELLSKFDVRDELLCVVSRILDNFLLLDILVPYKVLYKGEVRRDMPIISPNKRGPLPE
jgi:hypothetical protein